MLNILNLKKKNEIQIPNKKAVSCLETVYWMTNCTNQEQHRQTHHASFSSLTVTSERKQHQDMWHLWVWKLAHEHWIWVLTATYLFLAYLVIMKNNLFIIQFRAAERREVRYILHKSHNLDPNWSNSLNCNTLDFAERGKNKILSQLLSTILQKLH